MSTARLRVLQIFSLFFLLCGLATARSADAACPKLPGRYKVKIDSVPQGATIYFDSKNCTSPGVTPWSGKLPNGAITVIVEAPGYEPTTKVFNVGKLAREQVLTIAMTKRPMVEVRADADKNVLGAAVSLDGVPQGVVQGPLQIQTTAGRHQIEIKKEGFETLTQWVDLTSTSQLVLTPTLKEIAKPKYGTIVVEADVQDAEVYIDGNKHPDNTPSVINNVIEGVHVIEVKKAPGPPWRQTVQVTANQQTKVRAELAPLINAGVGVIRVLSDAPNAKAFLDGIDMGPVPVDIKDVKAGEHIVEVKAPGYQTGEKKVTVAAGGSQVVKFDLNTENDLVRIVSNTPDADVYVDGKLVGKAPQELKLAPGEHPIIVRAAGFKDYEETIKVEAGKAITIQAKFKKVGQLRILSTPSNATVTINGKIVGTTPFDQELEVGEQIVRIEAPGYLYQERPLTIEGGKLQTVSIELPVDTKSETELLDEQKGLSSMGARTLQRGRSTVDFEVGYPYFLSSRITVGAGRIAKQFGFDANVGVRTFLSRTELGLGGRMMLVNQSPFSAAVFSDIWFGSSLFDNTFRNGVTFNGGGMVSLTALSNVTITGRAYFQLWSDRHCPGLRDGTNNYEDEEAEGTSTCEDYRNTVLMQTDGYMADEDFSASKVEKLFGIGSGDNKRDFFGRDNGARFLISVAAEIALQQRWNLFGMLEGTPFQDERALFTTAFSGAMPKKDFNLYARFGLTYKF